MACSPYLTDLATSIYYAIGAPTGQPPSFIQSRLVSPSMVGQLNNLLTTCYVAVSGDISPPLGQSEQGIYSLLYQSQYYATRLNQTLAGLNPGITLLREGDSQISFTNPVDMARVFRDMQKQTFDELCSQVYAFRQQESQPSATDMVTIVNVPGVAGVQMNGNNPAQYPYGYYRS
jgi:hypothetical protein